MKKFYWLIVLVLLAAPVVADDVIDCAPGSGMHFNGATMVCDVPLAPHKIAHPPTCPDLAALLAALPTCTPLTVPGTPCIWPSVTVVSQMSTTEDMAWPNAKLVALVESEPLGLFGRPLPADFVRVSQHVNDCYAAPGKTPVCFWYDWNKP